MNKAAFLTAAAILALPTAAHSQDFWSSWFAPTVPTYQGFYIGAEGAANWLLNNNSYQMDTGWAAGGKIGYDFVGPRVELEGMYHSNTGTGVVAFPTGYANVRGRIDHKDRGETKLVVQEAERFEPDHDEIARASAAAAAPLSPLRLTIDAARLDNPHLIDELKTVIEGHRGDSEVYLAIPGRDGTAREWKLGNEFKVRHSSKLLAELDHLLGADALAA